MPLWKTQELKKDGLADADLTRRKLASTIVALASVGETDSAKLKYARGALQAEAGKARRAKKCSGRPKRRLKPHVITPDRQLCDRVQTDVPSPPEPIA